MQNYEYLRLFTNDLTFKCPADPLFLFFLLILQFHFFNFTEPESLLKNDNCVSDHENGVDIENDDDFPMMSDMDGVDHDPNDMSRPRKIRR